MKNLELKAHCPDLETAYRIAEAIGARFQWTQEQCDIYWQVPLGKLKLRRQAGQAAQLIAYHRPQNPESKLSHYQIVETADEDHLKAVLSLVLPIDVQICKIRTLFLWNHVRIHLDQVRLLGDFVEFEAMLDEQNPIEQAERDLMFLQERFSIVAEDLVECGYYELLCALRGREIA